MFELVLGRADEGMIQVDIVLTPMSSYYVDILHSRSAETLAASACVLTSLLLR